MLFATAGIAAAWTRRHKAHAVGDQAANLRCRLADDNLWIETEDAYEMARQLAREEGLLVGISAAANVWAATRVAEQLSNEGRSGLVVTMLCDGGQKYLSERFWND